MDVAACDLPDPAVAGRRELIESVVAAVDESGRTARAEHAGDQGNLVERRDPDARRLGASGVAQRAEEVEDRRDAEIRPHGTRVLEPGVEQRREDERDADFVEYRGHPLGRQLEVDTERREHVR